EMKKIKEKLALAKRFSPNRRRRFANTSKTI
ncbi:MAG: hypothetical protein ACI83B_002682, partial [Sediminicola sp.]